MVCNVSTRWQRCLTSMPILIGTVSGISGAPLANKSWRRGDGVKRIIRFVAMPSQKNVHFDVHFAKWCLWLCSHLLKTKCALCE